jgi:hypothetical protein
MNKTRFRLLVLAGLLTGAALLSTAPPVFAQCVRYCWHVDETTSCCQLWTCEIVC